MWLILSLGGGQRMDRTRQNQLMQFNSREPSTLSTPKLSGGCKPKESIASLLSFSSRAKYSQQTD
jgi:hypothetical protein